MKAYREVFAALDADDSGSLDKAELRDGFVQLGLELKNDEFDAAWHAADPNGDGEVGGGCVCGALCGCGAVRCGCGCGVHAVVGSLACSARRQVAHASACTMHWQRQADPFNSINGHRSPSPSSPLACDTWQVDFEEFCEALARTASVREGARCFLGMCKVVWDTDLARDGSDAKPIEYRTGRRGKHQLRFIGASAAAPSDDGVGVGRSSFSGGASGSAVVGAGAGAERGGSAEALGDGCETLGAAQLVALRTLVERLQAEAQRLGKADGGDVGAAAGGWASLQSKAKAKAKAKKTEAAAGRSVPPPPPPPPGVSRASAAPAAPPPPPPPPPPAGKYVPTPSTYAPPPPPPPGMSRASSSSSPAPPAPPPPPGKYVKTPSAYAPPPPPPPGM